MEAATVGTKQRMGGMQQRIRELLLLNSTLWFLLTPQRRDSQIDFSIRCMFPKWKDWNLQYTRKGLLKKRAGRALRICALVAVIVGAYNLRKDGGSLGNLPGLLRQIVRSSLLTVLDLNQAVNQRIRQVVSKV